MLCLFSALRLAPPANVCVLFHPFHAHVLPLTDHTSGVVCSSIAEDRSVSSAPVNLSTVDLLVVSGPLFVPLPPSLRVQCVEYAYQQMQQYELPTHSINHETLN